MSNKNIPIYYLIRHGEKPDKVEVETKKGKTKEEDPPGLSDTGKKRAQELIKIFGTGSQYNLGLIMAQNYGEDKNPPNPVDRERPWLTVKPLAESLGSQVKVNTDIDRDAPDKGNDPSAIPNAIASWRSGGGQGNVLICWEHDHLEAIANCLGVANAIPYPGDRFDQIWTIQAPYTQIDSMTSEHTSIDTAYMRVP